MGEFNVNKSDGSLEQTAGMPSEYPATQVMLESGDSVEEAIDELTADTIGTAVNISSYTSSNAYVFPSDGYVLIHSSSANAYVSFKISGMTWLSRQGGSDYQLLYVKKGMTGYVLGSQGSFEAYFYPLQ